MSDSNFVFDRGKPIEVGTHGEHELVFHDGDPVPDRGGSEFVFESGVGVGQGLLDGFERDNPTDRWRGDSGGASGSSARSYGGERSLLVDASSTSGGQAMQRGNIEVSQGEIYSACVYKTGLIDIQLSFGVQDISVGSVSDSGWSGYFVSGDNDDQHEIIRVDSGTKTELESANADINWENAWYKMIVRWADDGTIEFRVEDVNGNTIIGPLSAKDDTYTVGGWGLVFQGQNANFYVDNIDKTEI